MTTLHGTLSAALAKDYEQQKCALHQNIDPINRFGELVIEPFGLIPHIKPLASGQISLVALHTRGRDYAQLLIDLEANDFQVGCAEKAERQFNDGYVIWTVPVKHRELSFGLVFYTPLDVS